MPEHGTRRGAEELNDLVQRTRRFIREVVIPAEPRPGERLDQATRLGLQEAAREAGIFSPHAEQRFGGLGLPVDQWPAVFIEAGYSPIGPLALNAMAPDEGNMRLLEIVASPAQQERYLVPLVRGEVRSCFAMSEPHPGAGSDPAALQTQATRVDGGWRIDGTKRFISGADGAAFAIVMARTEADDDAPQGATMFLVDLDTDGVRLGAPIHAIDRAIAGGHPHLHFDGCLVADDAVLGRVGEGFAHAQVRLGPARLTHCMRWLGLARRSLDTALDRADHRELFGSRLGELGLAQELIAQSVIDLELCDAIIARTASALATDQRAGGRLSSIAKVHCAEAIWRTIDRAMQLCGGDGMSDALPLASFLDEVRPFRVYDGSTETHKWAIARRALSARRREREAGTARLDLVEETWR